MRNLTAGMLRESGVKTVLNARSEQDAMTLLQHCNPGLIVTEWSDAFQPGGRLSMVRQIRETERAPWRDAPIFLLSPPRGRRDVERARDAGVTEFLVRPLAPITMMERIAATIEGPRQIIREARFSGPDRRRRPLREESGVPFKRMRDVEDGRTTPMAAARAAADAVAYETILSGDKLAMRVGRSLRAYTSAMDAYGESEMEIVEMHRAALAQLSRMADNGDPLREPVVSGLEQVVARRLGKA